MNLKIKKINGINHIQCEVCHDWFQVSKFKRHRASHTKRATTTPAPTPKLSERKKAGLRALNKGLNELLFGKDSDA